MTDFKKKIPLKLKDVMTDIKNQYNKLDILIKFQECIKKKNTDNYIRVLWLHSSY